MNTALSKHRKTCLLAAVGSLMVATASHAAPLEYDCLIEPSQFIDIRSPVSGLIEKVHVERGQAVRKGMTLVTLESGVERSAAELARFRSGMVGAVQSANSRFAHADKKFKRKADLASKNYTSAQDKDEAEAEQQITQAEALVAKENKQMAQLEYQFATAQLAQRQLRSPIDGVVVEQSMNAGELAEPGDGKTSILKLARTNPLRVKAILPVALYPQLKPGQKAEVAPEKPFSGRLSTTVTVVDQVIDAASCTFQARMEIANPTGALPGGIKCKVSFTGR